MSSLVAPLPGGDIPNKLYFRIGEVGRLVGVPPYVLRYWETEFPSLAPKKTAGKKAGHRLYRRKDVELALEIKRLLYEKRFTIEGARNYLASRAGKHAPMPPQPPALQAGLFAGPSDPVLQKVKQELREILKLLG